MKRTRATTLFATGLAGIVLGFLLETAVTAGGAPLMIPPVSLPITIVAIGVIVVLLAVPIGRATRGKAGRPINPFVAMRVAVLAKASSLSGALLLGAGVGILVYLYSRSVIPAEHAFVLSGAGTIAAALLLVGGLVAEHLCTLPPDDPESHRDSHRGHQPDPQHGGSDA